MTIYSHTTHFVTKELFAQYVSKLLETNSEQKEKLENLMSQPIWQEVQDSSFWRHNLFNKGLNGPFTEYFACFNPNWSCDFWKEKVQPVDITYLANSAIARAYQQTVRKTQDLLLKKAVEVRDETPQIASLACGTMYDVLGVSYQKMVTFHGYDADEESLMLARQKISTLTKATLSTMTCDVVETALPEKAFDAVVLNGFSFYIHDDALHKVLDKVQRALKENGLFLMSFIQPHERWQVFDDEKMATKTAQDIYAAFPMNWTAYWRTGEQIASLLSQSGFQKIEIVTEPHNIHPLAVARKN